MVSTMGALSFGLATFIIGFVVGIFVGVFSATIREMIRTERDKRDMLRSAQEALERVEREREIHAERDN